MRIVRSLTFLMIVAGCLACATSGVESEELKNSPATSTTGVESTEEPQPAEQRPGPDQQGDRVTTDQVWLRFDGDEPGSVPAGLEIAETAGRGTTAVWTVVADSSAPSAPNAFGTIANKNYGRTFNLALAGESRLADVDVTVKVKAVAGQEDQGGGPVWRAADGDNYYIARWNPLEDNFRIYYVKSGERRQIATIKLKIDPRAWHEIRITMKGPRIEGWIDGEKMLTVEDDTFTGAGMAGLWIKADGLTLFDDFNARPFED